MLKIGALELGSSPRIAVPMSDAGEPVQAEALRRYADVIELRIDRFRSHDPAHVADVCRRTRALGHPLIATVRAADEGGDGALSDDQRLGLFAAALPLVDAVDVELRAPIRDRVVALARGRGALVIASHHDFTRTPSAAELDHICDAAGPAHDVLKIATYAADPADTERLLDVLRVRRRQGLIVIGMGPHGVASRVFFPLLGSLLTYGFVDRAAAPGQLPLAELYAALRRYSPPFAAAHPA